MRIYFLHEDHESGPFSIRDVRDRLDLRMIEACQPCRIRGRSGRYVAGEIVTGEVFRAWREEDDEDEDTEEEEFCGDDDDPRPADEADDEDDAGDGFAESEPMWSGHPGLGGFPLHLSSVLLLCGLAGAAWLWDWSGWMAAGFAALACFAFALLLARRQGTRYELHARRAQCSSGFLFHSVREVPRHAVEAIDVRVGMRAGVRGRGDVVFHWQSPRGMEELVFRDVFRPGRVRGMWRD